MKNTLSDEEACAVHTLYTDGRRAGKSPVQARQRSNDMKDGLLKGHVACFWDPEMKTYRWHLTPAGNAVVAVVDDCSPVKQQAAKFYGV